MDKPEKCQKCGRYCITKDDWLRGPLYGRYEWLCGHCSREEEMVYTLKWKRGTDPR